MQKLAMRLEGTRRKRVQKLEHLRRHGIIRHTERRMGTVSEQTDVTDAFKRRHHCA